MSDKTAALLAAGNAMAALLHGVGFSREADEWDVALAELDDDVDAKLPYALGVIEGQQENFIAHLKEFVGTKDLLKSDASYAYGYLEACDKTFEVRDLARASILHYNELLQIARDLATAYAIAVMWKQSDEPIIERANDAMARLQTLDRQTKKETSHGA